LLLRDHLLRNATPITIFIVAAGVRITAFYAQILGLEFWPSWLPGPNMWVDFRIYLGDLGLIAQGYLPYRDFSFNYGPLYLYSMLPFYEVSPYLAAVPTLIADAITSVLIYSVSKSIVDHRLAIASSLAYAISPFMVINEGYLWMSSQPMTMFIISAIYFMRSNRPLAGLLSIAIAALFKQEAIFILPVFLIAYARRFGWKVAYGLAAGSGTLLAGVAPFLILAPKAFIYSLMYGNFINFGPAEASQLPRNLANFLPSSFNGAPICQITTLPGQFTGTVCGNIVNTTQFLNSIAFARVEQFVLFLEPFLLILFALSFLAIRRSPVLLEFSSAYSILIFLFLFSTLVHGLYSYYMIPVYAILAASITDKYLTVATVAILAIVSFIPESTFVFLLPLLSVFCFVALESSRLNRIPANRELSK
jgi:hypothetical protein